MIVDLTLREDETCRVVGCTDRTAQPDEWFCFHHLEDSTPEMHGWEPIPPPTLALQPVEKE